MIAALRLLTCGSVDDGKSTLIGRLLYDAGLVAEDQILELKRDSRGRPVGPEGLDFSLLVDGLAVEREQGITIDVAYRYFATAERSFIVADAPGHEQYTRNMATAASNVDAAVMLVDASKGISVQTRRHALILDLMGVRNVALAVNKMDLVGNSETVFREIVEGFVAFENTLRGLRSIAIPVVAISGANVVTPAKLDGWYGGPTLLEWLEGVTVEAEDDSGPFRMPVQWVNRASADFRGLAGRVASGQTHPGDEVGITNTRRTTTIARIVTMDGDLAKATAGQAVTLVLSDDLDAGRGVMLFDPANPPSIADQFAANLIWLAEEPLLPHRDYLMRIGDDLLPAEVTQLKYRLNVNTLAHEAATKLETNEIGFCNLATSRPVAFDSYHESRKLGSFILIDRVNRSTVGAGMIEFSLRRSTNLAWQSFDVNRAARAAQKAQQPRIVWLTGLSGSGKSTIANALERRLHALGRHTFLLDGDNIRHGLNKDLGFTDADRVENIRRVANVARLMADAGLIVLVALISPFARERAMAREIAGEVEFREVFVDAPLSVCRERDPKGLYAKAARHEIAHLTGIDSPYEVPEAPDLRLSTDRDTMEVCVDAVLALIGERRK